MKIGYRTHLVKYVLHVLLCTRLCVCVYMCTYVCIIRVMYYIGFFKGLTKLKKRRDVFHQKYQYFDITRFHRSHKRGPR